MMDGFNINSTRAHSLFISAEGDTIKVIYQFKTARK
jgi:hypothetical protein